MPKNLWDFSITLRLYIIIFLIFYPLIYFIIQFGYLSPAAIMILGISICFIVRFVLFETRKSSVRLLKTSVIGASIIIMNFIACLIINIVHMNIANFIMALVILIGSGIYFFIMIMKRPFKKINSWLILKKQEWSNNGKHSKIKKKIFRNSLIFWLLISISLIVIPYPVYIQKYFTSNSIIQQNPKPKTDFGIWTYGQSLDHDYKDEPEYVDDKTLEMLGKADVYFIYGVNEKKIGHQLIENLNRCKNYDIEVHISVNPLKLSYTNIWTFESLRDETEEVLVFLRDNKMLGDPITTLVYDMELLPTNAPPHYALDPNIISKLNDYYDVQKKFTKFNDYVRKEYDLKIRICTDIYQAIDLKDNDDDLMSLMGLLSYEKADMSYMVYRRNNYGQNQILDHCKFLNDGDTIILNAWRDVGYLCWKNIKCAIDDCRLVLGYPKKTFRLEIWDISYFLYSFGIDGLYDLVEALNKDSTDWPAVVVWNIFPFSFLWDMNFIGIVALDIYAPLFRFIYNAY